MPSFIQALVFTNKLTMKILNFNYFLSFFIFIFNFVFYSYVHTMFGSFLPSPSTPLLPGRNYFALTSTFVEEEYKQ
jgi:hypothetical protein